MADSLAERLRKIAEQERSEQHKNQQSEALQEQINKFISDNAKPEYDRLLALINQRVSEINPILGSDLPPFQFSAGTRMLQQGNKIAVIHFEKPITNRPDNSLLVAFSPHPNAQYFMTQAPSPIHYRLRAEASDSLDKIVWLGNVGELTTEQLADFVIENLTTYFLKNKP